MSTISVPILVFLCLFFLDKGPMYATDRQTDGRTDGRQTEVRQTDVRQTDVRRASLLNGPAY